MSSQNRPTSPGKAPDPATSYERAKPEKESGMGALSTPPARPSNQADRSEKAVHNRQEARQINAHQDGNQRGAVPSDEMGEPEDVDHSMNDEEPLGWDQAPAGKLPDEQKRHPKTDGKGGTPERA